MHELTTPRRTRERGFTVVELLVVIVLLGVVGTVVTSAIVTAMNSARETTSRTAAIHELEVSLQRIGRELRAANPIYVSGDTPRRYHQHLGAEVLRDRQVRIVTYQVVEDGDNKQLVQDTTVFDLDEMAEEDEPEPIIEPRRELITAIDNDAVFTYYDGQGDELACDPTEVHSQIEEGRRICDGVYASARQITVRLVRELEDRNPIRAETHINVRNMRYRSGS